jgi:hypothetical protein
VKDHRGECMLIGLFLFCWYPNNGCL